MLLPGPNTVPCGLVQWDLAWFRTSGCTVQSGHLLAQNAQGSCTWLWRPGQEGAHLCPELLLPPQGDYGPTVKGSEVRGRRRALERGGFLPFQAVGVTAPPSPHIAPCGHQLPTQALSHHGALAHHLPAPEVQRRPPEGHTYATFSRPTASSRDIMA